MPGLTNNSLKRFIICYKRSVDGEIKKGVEIVSQHNEGNAITRTCNRLNIPAIKIDRNDNQEGYIYCNEVYNPTVNDFIQ